MRLQRRVPVQPLGLIGTLFELSNLKKFLYNFILK